MGLRFSVFLGLVPFLLAAQAPRVALIDFYGLKKTSESAARKKLGVKEGDVLPASKAGAEERLESLDTVVFARLEAVCCEAGGAILYVGIEEPGAPHFDLRAWPEGEVYLPDDVLELHRQFLAALRDAVRSGELKQDEESGDLMMRDPTARRIQEQFPELAEQHLEVLRDVLRNSPDNEHRATAVYLLGYLKEKRLITGDLQYALRDPDEGVRANAMRALTAVMLKGRQDPETGIRAQATWLVEMLNSLAWKDRLQASRTLVTLTEEDSPEVLAMVRERAMDSVLGMAKWKTPEHALPAFLLLGRMAGFTPAEIENHWKSQAVDVVARQALKNRK